MNKHNLNPCPLCGDVGGPEYVPSDGKVYGYVHCMNCGLHLSDNIADNYYLAAIRAWNDRTNSTVRVEHERCARAIEARIPEHKRYASKQPNNAIRVTLAETWIEEDISCAATIRALFAASAQPAVRERRNG